MAQQPNEKAAASLRLEAPASVSASTPTRSTPTSMLSVAGLIVQETRCDKGMQDNFALRAETTVDLTAS